MKKKFFSMLMVCVLAVCLCVPAFALEEAVPYWAGKPATGRTHVSPLWSSAFSLNAGSGKQNYENVNVWTDTNDDSQRWIFEAQSDGTYRVTNFAGYSYMNNQLNNDNFGLNIIRKDNNCTVLRYKDNQSADYSVRCVDEHKQGGDNCFGLVMVKHKRALQVDATSPANLAKNTNVYWGIPGEAHNQKAQLWVVVSQPK